MPGGDRTGPLGMGPMTGRAAGYCAGYDMPGYMNPMAGRGYWGWGRGRGGGRGWRNWFYATGLTGWQRAALGWPARGRFWMPHPSPFDAPVPTREQQLNMLQVNLQHLEQMAEQLRRRIEELKVQPSEKATP